MKDEIPELPMQGNSPPRRVPSRRLQGDDDVTEVDGSIGRRRLQDFAEWEGENIRRMVHASELAIEPADGAIVDERDRDPLLVPIESAQDAFGESRERARADAIFPLAICDSDHAR